MGSFGLHVCFSCSDLIKILPERHTGTEVSCCSSCCPLVCCLDKGWSDGSCSHQFRVCELGHPQVELSTSVALAGRERAPPAFCMGVFLPMTSLRTLSLAPSEWILNPLKRAVSSLLKSKALCLVCPFRTLFMPAKAQNQNHVCLIRNAVLSEPGAGPAAGDMGQKSRTSEVAGLNVGSPSGQ